MNRLNWLEKKHKELDNKITELESQREYDRSFDHKAALIDLKKQRLALKEEMQCYSNYQ